MTHRPIPQRIVLPDGREAIAVAATRTTSGDDLVAALDLPPARGVVALNGGTEEVEGQLRERLSRALGGALAGVARADALILVTGGTNAGAFALLGEGLADKPPPASVGVAVADLVVPRAAGAVSAGSDDDRVPLEPHHTHFVLAEGQEWGDETSALLALLGALDRDTPSVAVIAGGGEVTRREALGHAQAGRPLIVLAGSGRFADELCAWAERDPATPPAPRELAQLIRDGKVDVVALDGEPDGLARAVRKRVVPARPSRGRPALVARLPRLRVPQRVEPILPGPARQAHPALADDFSFLDRELMPAYERLELEARRAQNQFWMEQLLLIVGGAALTVLGVVQTALTGQAWPGIVEAVIGGLVSAVALRARELSARERHMGSRLKAERLKSEYFLYLGRSGDYASDPDAEHTLRHRIVQIETDPAS
jgi:hypothetical protein